MPHEGNGCDKRQWVLAALDQHECRLTRYAMRIAGDEEAARDAVQHVFLRLCDQSPAELNGRLLPWLYTVCRNKIVDQLRRSGRHESLDTPDSRAIVGREPDPALTAEQQDLGEWLREVVEALPTSLREVLDLWLDGFSHPEIAEITDRAPGYVRAGLFNSTMTASSDNFALTASRNSFDGPGRFECRSHRRRCVGRVDQAEGRQWCFSDGAWLR